MSDVQQGDVLVSLPQGIELPERAGKMNGEEIKRLTKAPEDGNTLVEEVAKLILRPSSGFVQHPEITPEMLQQAAAKAVMFRRRQTDLELLATCFGQACMLADGEAWNLLLRMYDWIKIQAKHNASLRTRFHVLFAHFAHKPKRAAAQPEPQDKTAEPEEEKK